MFNKKVENNKKGNVNDLFANTSVDSNSINNLDTNNLQNNTSNLFQEHNFTENVAVDKFSSGDDNSIPRSKKELKAMKKQEKKMKKKGGKEVQAELQSNADVQKPSNKRDVAVDILKGVEVNENDAELIDSEFAFDDFDLDSIEKYVNEIIGLLGYVKSGTATYNLGWGDLTFGYYITKQGKDMIMHVPFSLKTKPYQIKSLEEKLMTSDSFSSVLKFLKPEMVYNVSAYRAKLNTQDLVDDYSVQLHKSLHSYGEEASEKLAKFYDERKKSFLKNMENIEEVKYHVVISKPVNLSIDEFNSEKIFVEETKEFIRAVDTVMREHLTSFAESYKSLAKHEVYEYLVYSLSQTVANFNDDSRGISMTEAGKWGEYTDTNIYLLQAIDSLRNSIRMQNTEKLNRDLTMGEAQIIAAMIENDSRLMEILQGALEMRCKYNDSDGKEQYISKSVVNNL